MYSLRLNGRACICCGICMDVCGPRAIALRTKFARTIEGSRATYLLLQSLQNRELPPTPMGTFPYLRDAALCDGCCRCVTECPTMALELRRDHAINDALVDSCFSVGT